MAKNNYHDLVNREEIADSVAWWNGKGKDDSYKHPFTGKTVDEAIAYWEAQAKKTDDLEKALRVFEEHSDLLATDEDFVMIRELLTHPERDRMRLIHDGSYYTHRIWFDVDVNGRIKLRPSICWKDSEFKRMSNQMHEKSAREQIDFLFKNFEVVYVQTRNVENREDVERWIRDEMAFREYDRMPDWADWEDID